MMFEPFPDEDSRISSANVQAEIYRECCKAGLECRCEYLYEFEDDRATQGRISIDCAVIHAGYVVCVAEAKRYANIDHMKGLNSKQAWNYSLLPVPAYFVARRRHAPHFAKLAKELLWHTERGQTRYGQIRVILDGSNGGPQSTTVTVENRSNE